MSGFAAIPFTIRMQGVAFTRDISSAGGSQPVVGVGFKPASMIVMASNPSGTGQFGIYFVDSALGVYALVNSTATTTVNTLYQGAIRIGSDVAGAATFASATVASFDTDGFTLTWATKTGSPTGTVNFMALCFR